MKCEGQSAQWLAIGGMEAGRTQTSRRRTGGAGRAGVFASHWGHRGGANTQTGRGVGGANEELGAQGEQGE